MKKTKQWSTNLRKQKGITLISLVITIVVLIILAGVAINLTLGENGILKRAEYAREQHKMAEVKEKIEVSILDIQTDKLGSGGNCTIDTLVSELPGKLNGLTITKDGEGAKGTYNDCDFTIDSNLNVTINGYNPSAGGSTSGGAHTHSYTETITKAATCTEIGEKTLTCSCGDSRTETIPVSHNYVDDVCTECNQTVDGYTAFTLTSSNYSQAGITREGNVVIPQTFEYDGVNYKVTTIGMNAFLRCENLTSVQIPESVKTIGTQAFNKCTKLTTVQLPSELIAIGNSAFWGCTSLLGVVIPDGVTSIGTQAFAECTALSSVGIKGSGASIELPNSLTSLEKGIFQECTGLTSVEIPEGVTNIGEKAFSLCKNITSIKISDTVTNIGERAFAQCEKLESLTIGKKVTKIEKSAFTYCESLINIVLPSSVLYIGDEAFSGNTLLTNINIPNSVTYVGSKAFGVCKALSATWNGKTYLYGERTQLETDLRDAGIYTSSESLWY